MYPVWFQHARKFISNHWDNGRNNGAPVEIMIVSLGSDYCMAVILIYNWRFDFQQNEILIHLNQTYYYDDLTDENQIGQYSEP